MKQQGNILSSSEKDKINEQDERKKEKLREKVIKWEKGRNSEQKILEKEDITPNMKM